MTKFFKIFLLLALVLAPTTAKADVEDGTVIDARVVAPLMAWVEQQTGIQVPVLPQVVASRSAFKEVLSRMGGRFAGRPRALFVDGKVLVDNELWDEEDDTQRSLLLHELVHYAQTFMQKTWMCGDEREVLAYTLQNKWLAEHDHSAFVNASWIRRVSSCGEATVALAQTP